MAVEHTITMIRDGKEVLELVRLTPMRAIRFQCLQCCANQVKEIRECPITTCASYPYRLGKRPDMGENDDEDFQNQE